MALSNDFIKVVSDRLMWEVYQRLADIMAIDPTLQEQDEMLKYAEKNLPNLYQEHDGEELNFSSSDWDEEYYKDQKYHLEQNFSEKRLRLLREMTSHQFADTIKYRSEQEREREATKRLAQIDTGRKIGNAVTVVGVGLVVGGVATSTTAAIIAGAFVAVGGIAVGAACSTMK